MSTSRARTRIDARLGACVTANGRFHSTYMSNVICPFNSKGLTLGNDRHSNIAYLILSLAAASPSGPVEQASSVRIIMIECLRRVVEIPILSFNGTMACFPTATILDLSGLKYSSTKSSTCRFSMASTMPTLPGESSPTSKVTRITIISWLTRKMVWKNDSEATLHMD
jgi:hypothetical protein